MLSQLVTRRSSLGLAITIATTLLVGVATAPPAAASAYSDAVLADDPEGYWRMSDLPAVPNVVATVPGLSVSGAGGLVPGAILGDSDQAVDFDGDTTGSTSVDAVAANAVELWFKTTSTGSTERLVRRAQDYGIELLMGSGRVFARGRFGQSQALAEISSPDSYADNEWHHVVATAGNGPFALWVDGGLVAISGQGAMSSNPPGILNTFVVGSNAGSEFFDGHIDEVAAYQHALTPAQIRAHFVASGRTPPPPTPLERSWLLGGSMLGARNICECVRQVAQPIDTSTGNFWHTFSDLSLGGRGPGVSFTRTYNSYAGLTMPNGPFGWGWQFSYGSKVITASGASPLTIRQENGSELTFTDVGGVWTAPSFVTSTLQDLGTQLKLTRNKRDISIFDEATGRLIERRDLNGYSTTFAYDGSGKLTSVTDSSGRVVTVSWTGANITSVADQFGRSVAYTYSGAGDLTDVIDVRGGHWQFTYDGSHRMLTMRSPRWFGDTSTPAKVITNHYDAQGRVDWQSDELGRTTSFDYATLADDNDVIVTDPKGFTVLYDYDAGRHLTSETHGYGVAGQDATTTYGYDWRTLGAETITDPAGRTWTTILDPAGNRVMAVDPLGNTATMAYDDMNNLVASVDPTGQLVRYEYDANENLTRSVTNMYTYPSGVNDIHSTIAYDPAKPGDALTIVRPVEANDPVQPAITNTYEAMTGALLTSTDPTGKTSSFTSDGLGRQVSVVPPRGNAAGAVANDFRSAQLVDDGGFPVVSFNALASPIADGFTRVSGISPAETGHAWTARNSSVWSIEAGDAKLTTAGTGSKSFLTTVGPADGTIIALASAVQNSAGLVLRYNNTTNYMLLRANTTNNRFDLVKVSAGTETILGNTGANTCCTPGTFLVVNEVANAFKVSVSPDLTLALSGSSSTTSGGTVAALAVTDSFQSGYSHAGLYATTTGAARWDLVAMAKQGGAISAAKFDANGNQVAAIDPDGRRTTYVYDAANQPTTVNRAGGSQVGYAYDNNGMRVSYTDARGKVTTWEYNDPAFPGAVTKETPPAGKGGTAITQYAYNRDGSLGALTDALGRTTTYGYDGAARLASVNYSDPATPDVTAIGYDANGRRTSLTDGLGTSSWAYDEIGRVTSSTLAGTGTGGTGSTTTTYTYNARDLLKINYAGAGDLTMVYDDASRLTSQTDWAGRAYGFVYDDDTNLTRIDYPSTNGLRETWSYDNAGRVSQVQQTKPATSTTYGTFAYARTALGQVSGITTTDGTGTGTHNLAPAGAKTYSYTSLNSLSSITPSGGTYTYETGGDLINKFINQPSGNTYQRYSDAGEVCWAKVGTTNGANCSTPPASPTVFGYDALGQRTSMTPATGAATSYGYDQAQRLKTISGATTASYVYNGDGLRTSKTVAGTTTAFSWDVARGLPLLLSQNVGGTVSRYVYGPGGLPLAQVTGSTINYYHRDQLGSTRIVTNSTGNTVGVTNYDPFGQSPASWKSGTQPAFAYAGQYTDAETGFQYLRARYYDPTTAQFLTRDPAYATTLDAYGYTLNNPLNATDPSGLWGWSNVKKWAGDRVDDLGDALPDCPLGHNPDGGCRGAETVRKYADDVSRVAGYVSSVCGVAAVATSGTGVGGAAFGTCASVSKGVSIGAGVLHTAVTCADVDAYCARSAAATVVTIGTMRLSSASAPTGSWIAALRASSDTASEIWMWRFVGMLNIETFGNLGGLFIDTTERPNC